MTTKSFDWKRSAILGFCAVMYIVATYAATANQIEQSPPKPSGANQQLPLMLAYAKQGRYDEAVDLGLKLARDNPKDSIIYQQIANIYLIRAKKDGMQRETWLGKAAQYLDEAVSSDSKDIDVAGVNLFEAARGFEASGDMSEVKKCVYYRKAAQLLKDRTSRLRGDQLTLAGKTFPVEPLREENSKVLSEIKGKAAKSGCN